MRILQFTTDQSLVQCAGRGDQNAFNEIVKRHGARIFHLLRRLTNNPDLAEDLAQETFISAYGALGTWRAEGALSTWLCGIAVRRYTADRRRKSGPPVVDYDDETAATTFVANDDPLAHLKRREAEAALTEAIAALSDSCRDVYVLVRVEELSYQMVSDLLEIPLGTVQSRLNRATKFLHQRLSPLLYGMENGAFSQNAKGVKHDV